MPHKRAKRSVRTAEAAKRGSNLPPSSANYNYNDTPASAARILNSQAARNAFRASGRTSSEDTGVYAKRKRKVHPGAGALANPRSDSNTTTNDKASVNAKARVNDKASVNDNDSASSTPGVGKSNVSKSKKRAKLSTSSTSADPASASPSTSSRTKAPGVGGIRPHESLREYNQRVEAALRPGLNKAMKLARSADVSQLEKAKGKGKKRKALDDGVDAPALHSHVGASTGSSTSTAKGAGGGGGGSGGTPGAGMAKKQPGFAPIPPPRRLNDIVQAPPSLPSLRRTGGKGDATGVWSSTGKGGAVLNAGQRRVMEEERERVVMLYRAIKERKAAEREREGERAKDGRRTAG